ncbi:MAG: LysM peptidoglycan-binding domain-containing protein [Acidobacteriota bacterium]|jgi:nucleoid-associated protein YgaU
MALEKLRITNQDTGTSFEVLFNPSEYSIEDANTWEEQKKPRRKPELQFTGQALKKLSMELFLDTYEAQEDVRDHTVQLARLLVASESTSEGKRPPICQIEWGGAVTGSGVFPFRGVLESLKQQFVLFTEEGTPVRARLAVAFKEYIPPSEEAQENTQRGSFPERSHTVRSGETLSSIAALLWRQPESWRRIAEANDIDNPRLLTPGQVLRVPAIE